MSVTILVLFNLSTDPMDSRMLRKAQIRFDRTQMQPSDYVKWDILQIRRVLRRYGARSFDAMILGDSRGRQLSGGMYSDRAFVDRDGRHYIDLSMVGLPASDYLQLRDFSASYLKSDATTFVQLSFHGLGQHRIFDIASKWREASPWKYAIAWSTFRGGLELLIKRYSPAPSIPGTIPAPTVTNAEIFDRAQSVQRDRAESIDENVFDAQLDSELPRIEREFGGSDRVLFFNLPLHDGLLEHIRSRPETEKMYEKFEKFLANRANAINLQSSSCPLKFLDGIHFAPPTLECLKKELLLRAEKMRKGP